MRNEEFEKESQILRDLRITEEQLDDIDKKLRDYTELEDSVNEAYFKEEQFLSLIFDSWHHSDLAPMLNEMDEDQRESKRYSNERLEEYSQQLRQEYEQLVEKEEALQKEKTKLSTSERNNTDVT
ncbi:DUF3958 family protein [uncultured Enterococcus sp.]|uniref:DUF3958 family protein n=1 Tax=uncultured Enterococcus sp. TaxID=167972 RepID=UPI002AA7E1E2|nr:DUF3958 family protein [uncultured Enterococcus sp.]